MDVQRRETYTNNNVNAWYITPDMSQFTNWNVINLSIIISIIISRPITITSHINSKSWIDFRNIQHTKKNVLF